MTPENYLEIVRTYGVLFLMTILLYPIFRYFIPIDPNIWFQQDGAIPNALSVRSFINEVSTNCWIRFRINWIGRWEFIEYHPRSPDVNLSTFLYLVTQ